MKLVWTSPADADRERIIFFIAQDNLEAAFTMDNLFTSAAESLVKFPEKGRSGRIPHSWELVVHKNYVLIYGIDKDNDTVYIKAVLHTSRQYPPE